MTQEALTVAFSFCPNDTALFFPWVKGILGKHLPINPILADIQTLNEMAIAHQADLIKVSAHCLGKVNKAYRLLPVGAALGYNVGPKVIANKPLKLNELENKKIAIPGKETTAHLLFDIFAASYCLGISKHFCPYNEIFSLLKKGVVDAGVIIHESRFTFTEAGFYEVCDLGALWHEKTSLPLPLGCLLASSTLSAKVIAEITHILEQCYAFFLKEPESAMEYVLAHSQEKDKEVVKKHIALYVTQETGKLSPQGIQSIQLLIK